MKLRLLVAFLFSIALGVIRAQDVSLYGVAKVRQFQQTSQSGPVLVSHPYGFGPFVDVSPGGLQSASLKTPRGSVLPLSLDGSQWDLKGLGYGYLSQAALDADFPDGTYTCILNTTHDGNKSVALPLIDGTYPPAPQIQNFGAAQAVNPGGAFSLVWNSISSTDASDFIQLQIQDATGNTVFKTPDVTSDLNGTVTSTVVPAGTLSPNATYTASLLFVRTVSFDPTSYGQGVNGVASYVSRTQFSIVTTSAPDVTRILLAKGLGFQQSSSAVPVTTGQAYLFRSEIGVRTGGVSSATLLLPNGTTQTLSFNGDQFKLKAAYLSQAGLIADFPSGTYTFTVHAVHDGVRTVPLTLPGDSYPNAPRVVNFSDAQAVNSTQPFTVVWNTFTEASAGDYVGFRVDDASGNTVFQAPDVGTPGALTGTSAPQFVIPANTLAVNTSYTCRLLFAHFTQVNTTSYGQGVTGYAGNYSETKFPLITSAPLDVKRFAVIKGAIYRQTGLGVPALVDGKPYDFNVFVDSSNGGVASATLRLPSGAVESLISTSPDSVDLQAQYLTQAALDADYPQGSYTLTLSTAHNGIQTISLPIPSTTLPNSPQIVNFAEAQAVNPNTDFKVTWNGFKGGTVNDYIQLSVPNADGNSSLYRTPQPGQAGALNGTDTMTTIPANTLPSGQTLQVRILFVKLLSQSTTYSFGFSAFYSQTEAPLVTTGVAVAPTLSIDQTGPNQWHLHSEGGIGQNYVIETTPSLTPPVNWQTMVNFQGSTSGFDFTDGVVHTQAFYRVRPGN